MTKNTKVTVDAGMIASIVAAAVAKAMEQYITAAPAVTPVKKSAAAFSAALGVTVTKKWVTLKPVMVNDITDAERKIQARAFKAAMLRNVGYMQATYAGYHAVANSR